MWLDHDRDYRETIYGLSDKRLNDIMTRIALVPLCTMELNTFTFYRDLQDEKEARANEALLRNYPV